MLGMRMFGVCDYYNAHQGFLYNILNYVKKYMADLHLQTW